MSANNPLPSEALAQLFTEARTHNGWRDREVPDALLREVFERTNDQPFAAIEDVISRDEIAALSEGYKRIAGYSKEALRG